MKRIALVLGGMSDRPIEQLNDRTPLEVARTPAMDLLARNGICATLKTVAANCASGPQRCNPEMFGYKSSLTYCGHAAYVARHCNIPLDEDDVVFMVSPVTIDEKGKLVDPYAGFIRAGELKALFSEVCRSVPEWKLRFHVTGEHDGIMIIKKGTQGGGEFNAECISPFHIVGKKVKRHYPRAGGSEILIQLMEKMNQILDESEINAVRVDLGENPASMLWLWGPSAYERQEPFSDKYGVRGAVITENTSISGFAGSVDLPCVIDLANQEEESQEEFFKRIGASACKAIADYDYLFVYVDSARFASYQGKMRDKITLIEYFDKEVVKPFSERIQKNEDCRVAVFSDATTPVEERVDLPDPVPMVVAGRGVEQDAAEVFSERSTSATGKHFKSGKELMKFFMEDN